MTDAGRSIWVCCPPTHISIAKSIRGGALIATDWYQRLHCLSRGVDDGDFVAALDKNVVL
jgi:hypothetical protein